jgi:hypothetical protein
MGGSTREAHTTRFNEFPYKTQIYRLHSTTHTGSTWEAFEAEAKGLCFALQRLPQVFEAEALLPPARGFGGVVVPDAGTAVPVVGAPAEAGPLPQMPPRWTWARGFGGGVVPVAGVVDDVVPRRGRRRGRRFRDRRLNGVRICPHTSLHTHTHTSSLSGAHAPMPARGAAAGPGRMIFVGGERDGGGARGAAAAWRAVGSVRLEGARHVAAGVCACVCRRAHARAHVCVCVCLCACVCQRERERERETEREREIWGD